MFPFPFSYLPGGVAIPTEFIFEVNATIGDTIDLTTKNDALAADFIINWGEGANETVNATTASHTYASAGTKVIKINIAGTSTPVNNFNVLATNEGRSMVTKISNWGNTEWYSLKSGFTSCTNLTVIASETELLTASNATELFYATFQNCTGLTEADMSNWATNNIVWYLRSTFHGCTNIALVKAPASNVMPLNYFGTSDSQAIANSAFSSVGTTTANGATFEFGSLDFSTATITKFGACFSNCKINGNTSDFSNWVFDSSVTSLQNLFYFADVVGTNPTLDISGWTTFQGSDLRAMFRGLNAGTALNNLTLNVSNLNVSNVNSMYLFMGHTYSDNYVENIIGLSTWGATAGAVNMGYAFAHTKYLKLTALDNFSDAFMNSLTPSNFNYTFAALGFGLASGFGEPPNFASLDLSSATTVESCFSTAKFSTLPDFSSVTFPTAAVSYKTWMKNIEVGSVIAHFDLSSKTFKPTDLSRGFEGFKAANKITLPSGASSFSSLLTNMSYAFYNGGGVGNELEVILPTDADYSSVTNWLNAFNGLNGPGSDTLTTCVGDTLIRRLHATSLNTNQQALNLVDTKLTGSPSVVDSNVTALEAAGWTITSNAVDAVMPFVYATPVYQNISTTPTGSFTGGTFSSSDPTNAAVNATTGEVTSSIIGDVTITYTLADGCYNQQALSFLADPRTVDNAYSMVFDGTNDYVDITPATTITGSASLSLWFKTSSAAAYQNLVGSGGGSYPGMCRYLTVKSGKLNNYVTGVGWIELDSTAVNDGNWHHLVFTYDSTTTGGPQRGTFKAYIDGSLTKTYDMNGSTEDWSSNSLATIGNYSSGVGRWFNGDMDEVAIWDIILSPTEVQDIYDFTSTGKTGNLNYLTTTPPTKWYRMGD